MSVLIKQPLIRLWLYLSFSTAVLLSPTLFHWLGYGLLFIFIALIENVSIIRIIRSLRSFFFFLPVMIGFYFIISIIMTQSTLFQIFVEIGTAMIKFILVMAIMNMYTIGSGTGSVFQALRSIWVQFNKPWRKVEDWFLFMEMTLRFYPSLQRDWSRWQGIHKALGLNIEKGRIQRWKETARQLPGMIMIHLHRADDIACAMTLRGYGRQIPRGVAQPIPFTKAHFFILLIISFIFVTLHNIAQI
jgi:energy-coupling factor transporter transmembrane protein EcfT